LDDGLTDGFIAGFKFGFVVGFAIGLTDAYGWLYDRVSMMALQMKLVRN
jgi:hypothetical protein